MNDKKYSVYNETISGNESSQSNKSNSNVSMSKATSERSKYNTPLSRSLLSSLRKSSRNSIVIDHLFHSTSIRDYAKDIKWNGKKYPKCHVTFNHVESKQSDKSSIIVVYLKTTNNTNTHSTISSYLLTRSHINISNHYMMIPHSYNISYAVTPMPNIPN